MFSKTSRPFMAGRSAIILLAVAVAATALSAGCAATSRASKAKAKNVGSSEKVAPGSDRIGTDLRELTYGVSWQAGSAMGDGTYKVAYAMREGNASVVENELTGFRNTSSDPASLAKDPVRAKKIRDYILMGPIRPIIGDRTQFEVGQTYDGTIKEGGKPLFTYSCDAREEIAGVSGYRLTVRSARGGKTELEVVLSPDFQFPLYVKEHTGDEPLQIFLKEKD